jgi:hypothetical protein
MMIKRGINNTRVEKEVKGPRNAIPSPDRQASASTGGVSRVVKCASCGTKFEKSCPDASLCKVINTHCPKCGGDLA